MTSAFEGGHPTSLELIGLLDGDGGDGLGRGPAVLDHVAGCRECQADLLSAAPALAGAPGGTLADSVPSSLPDALLGALRAEPPSEVAAGQLWRLTWDELYCLAVVTEVEPVTVTVAAASLTGDSAATAVAAARSPLGVPFDVHLAFPTSISRAALDTYLGQVEIPAADFAAATAGPVVQTLQHLAESSLAWLPPVAEDETDEPTLREQFEAAGVTFDDVADVVGDEAGLALWRGDRAPSDTELPALASVGIEATVPAQRRAPRRLLELVTAVDIKADVRTAAKRRATSETAVRQRLLEVTLAPAARTTGSVASASAEVHWRAIIDHELRS